MEKLQYVMTERAHLMCPNMHFGIKARITTDFDRAKAKNTAKLLANAHPFLKSVIAMDEIARRLYYKHCEEMTIPLIVRDHTDLWASDYQSLTKNGWDV